MCAASLHHQVDAIDSLEDMQFALGLNADGTLTIFEAGGLQVTGVDVSLVDPGAAVTNATMVRIQ